MKITVEPNHKRKTDAPYPIMLKMGVGRGNLHVPISLMEAQDLSDQLRALIDLIYSAEEGAAWEMR